ncbi:hypothetical protein SAMN05421823_112108 [Catalinimonas alkaloidigena]|uniref:DUF1152 domain-containing protein n=1 Tax=Catalinimonas alkaloidigena TaxID=1075417 RepID=A0A1G9SDY1_9BACT|nr:DUF1152 domain-containing protein [Catalinimonas alkaloidigena]SDM33005.1 hypothetical protein SAMN05421823_112108 [Catalinimonas alkaloidigena]
MSYSINQIPIFEELKESKSILLAGAGGGFDIFGGIPLYFNLKKQGKKVILANLSFTWLIETTSEQVFPFCYKIRSGDSDVSGRNYFPERYLKLWFGLQGENVEIYGFENTGVVPLKNAYTYLIKKHEIDTVLLVDGGTDSLMFGDEDGLGTPQEDVCSMAAVYRSGIKKQFLLSVGFGIDHFHGVSHFRFLENVAQLAKEGGYLGMFQLTKEMEEAHKYIEAVRFANEKMSGKESIVSNSIVSALEGEYGNQHRTIRTTGSELWINPLMTIYWCFDLRKVIRKIKYYDKIKDVNTIGEFNGKLSEYRNELSELRDKKQIPI